MKKRRVLNMIVLVLFMASILICLIVNFAVEGKLTWAWFVVGGCMVGYLTVGALLLSSKNRIMKLLLVWSVTLIPYLYLIEICSNQYLEEPQKWAGSFGVPVSICWLLVLWVLFFIRKFTHANVWLMLGMGTLLFFVAERFTNEMVDRLAGSNESWRLSEEFPVIYFAVAACFLIIGLVVAIWRYSGRKREKA